MHDGHEPNALRVKPDSKVLFIHLARLTVGLVQYGLVTAPKLGLVACVRQGFQRARANRRLRKVNEPRRPVLVCEAGYKSSEKSALRIMHSVVKLQVSR